MVKVITASDEMDSTKRGVRGLLCGFLSAFLMSVALLLIEGWQPNYSLATTAALGVLSFSVGAQIRRSVGPRGPERWRRVRPFIFVPAFVSLMLALFLPYFVSAQVESAYVPVFFLYGGMLGYTLNSALGALDYVMLAAIGFIMSGTIGALGLPTRWATVLEAGSVSVASLVGDFVLTGGKPPEVDIVDVGLSGPVLGLVLYFCLSSELEDVPLGPGWIAVGILVAMRVLWTMALRRSRAA
jgi:hypothetical protein